MNFVTVALTILTLSICGPGKNIIQENQEVQIPSKVKENTPIKFKKVPTKWVKISKKSN